MSNLSRKARGMRTQLVAAQLLQGLWPLADSTGAGRPGVDILHTPGVAVEVKARRDLNISAWLRQAAKAANGSEYPVLIYRPDGAGEATVDQWPVIMPAGEWLRLAEAAGLGGVPS